MRECGLRTLWRPTVGFECRSFSSNFLKSVIILICCCFCSPEDWGPMPGWLGRLWITPEHGARVHWPPRRASGYAGVRGSDGVGGTAGIGDPAERSPPRHGGHGVGVSRSGWTTATKGEGRGESSTQGGEGRAVMYIYARGGGGESMGRAGERAREEGVGHRRLSDRIKIPRSMSE